MDKKGFLDRFRTGLSGIPQKELDERLTFYDEMLQDRMEEGFSEEEAVEAVGSADEIIAQILAEFPRKVAAEAQPKPEKTRKAWQIVLLAVGSPVWLSLLIASLAVAVALYVSAWAIIISLWAVFGSLAGCAFGLTVSGVYFACNGNLLTGIAVIGGGMVCAGLAIFWFFGCGAATKGMLTFTKRTARWCKNRFVKKEVA